MKKIPLALLFATTLTSFSGCSIINTLSNNIYKSLDDYFKKNNYTETKSADEFNSIMQKHVYFWQKKIQTYTNTSRSDEVCYSPQSDSIIHFEEAGQYTIRSRYSEQIVVLTNSDYYRITYEFEDDDKVYWLADGSFVYANPETGYLEPVDEKHENVLKMHEYNDGYLFVTNKNFMFYFNKDYSKYYINTKDTNEFTNADGSIYIPQSDLLNDTLSKLPKKQLFTLPLPKGYSNAIYHKDYVSEKDNEWIAYDVILPYIQAVDYVKLIKEQGLEIYRGEYHPIYAMGGENGGEWVFYDRNHELKIHLEYENPIAVTLKSDNYGVRMRIQKAEEKFCYYGQTVTSATDWTDEEKKTMTDNFGIVLPFEQLGRRLHFSGKRANGEMPLESALDMDVECYWIFDNFYKDVITESYGDKLIEAGFRKYEEPKDKDELQKWKDSEDVKYYECYLKEDLDLAVKFLFDDIYGNTIKVFKISELKSWHIDE